MSLEYTKEGFEKRWDGGGGDHDLYKNINKKFGYAIFCASMFNILMIILSSFIRRRIKPANYSLKTKKKSLRLLYFIVNLSLVYQVALWTIFGLLLLLIPYYQAMTSTPVYIHFKLWMGMLKRSGRIGLALYPLIIFMSLKPNPLPNVLYIHLLPLHKWISRISFIAITFHCFGFIAKWMKSDGISFYTHLFGPTILPGFIVFVMFTFTFILGIKPIREKCYKLFYCIHIIMAWCSIPLMYIHCIPEANLYIFGSLILLVYNTFIRIWTSRKIRNDAEYSVITKPDSNLVVIRFGKEQMKRLLGKYRGIDSELLSYSPGSHIRLSYSNLNLKSWLFASHPYTITSSEESETFDLILNKATKFAQELLSNNYGSFAVSSPFPAFESSFFQRSRYQKIEIVCSGTGIAFALPIFNYFYSRNKIEQLENESNTEGESLVTNFCEINFIWITRNASDLFVLNESGLTHSTHSQSRYEIDDYFQDANIEVYITGTPSDPPNSGTSRLLFLSNIWNRYVTKTTNEDPYIPLAEIDEPLNSDSFDLESSSNSPSKIRNENMKLTSEPTRTLNTIHERPVLADILSSQFEDIKKEEKNCIIACGSQSLLKDCDSWAKSNNIDIFTEAFSV